MRSAGGISEAKTILVSKVIGVVGLGLNMA